MFYSLEPSRYFLLSIFQVWSKYVKYPQLYEGRNEPAIVWGKERTRSCMREGTNERTYTTTKHITTLLLPSRVKKINYCLLKSSSEKLLIFDSSSSSSFLFSLLSSDCSLSSSLVVFSSFFTSFSIFFPHIAGLLVLTSTTEYPS